MKADLNCAANNQDHAKTNSDDNTSEAKASSGDTTSEAKINSENSASGAKINSDENASEAKIKSCDSKATGSSGDNNSCDSKATGSSCDNNSHDSNAMGNSHDDKSHESKVKGSPDNVEGMSNKESDSEVSSDSSESDSEAEVQAKINSRDSKAKGSSQENGEGMSYNGSDIEINSDSSESDSDSVAEDRAKINSLDSKLRECNGSVIEDNNSDTNESDLEAEAKINSHDSKARGSSHDDVEGLSNNESDIEVDSDSNESDSNESDSEAEDRAKINSCDSKAEINSHDSKATESSHDDNVEGHNESDIEVDSDSNESDSEAEDSSQESNVSGDETKRNSNGSISKGKCDEHNNDVEGIHHIESSVAAKSNSNESDSKATSSHGSHNAGISNDEIDVEAKRDSNENECSHDSGVREKDIIESDNKSDSKANFNSNDSHKERFNNNERDSEANDSNSESNYASSPCDDLNVEEIRSNESDSNVNDFFRYSCLSFEAERSRNVHNIGMIEFDTVTCSKKGKSYPSKGKRCPNKGKRRQDHGERMKDEDVLSSSGSFSASEGSDESSAEEDCERIEKAREDARRGTEENRQDLDSDAEERMAERWLMEEAEQEADGSGVSETSSDSDLEDAKKKRDGINMRDGKKVEVEEDLIQQDEVERRIDEKNDQKRRKRFKKKERHYLLQIPISDSDESEAEVMHEDDEGSLEHLERRAEKRKGQTEDQTQDRSYKKKRKRRRSKTAGGSDGEDEKSDGEDGETCGVHMQPAGESESHGTPGRLRKQIRNVLPDSQLLRSTREAEDAEKERRARIEEKRRMQFDDGDDGAHLQELVLEYSEDKLEKLIEVDVKLAPHLKPHQIDGVRFLWESTFESLEKKDEAGRGAILAHCMGLGKTLQVIAYLHTILRYSELGIGRVLVVAPLNAVLNWVDEFKKWLKQVDHSIDIYELTSVKNEEERAATLEQWHEEGGVLVISYSLFYSLVLKTTRKVFREILLHPGPDIVVCDEGHMIKNDKTGRAQALNSVRTRRRICLTGTPLQNNLMEYYSMVNFVKPNLLGSQKEYKNRFVNPITNGQCSDSSRSDVRLMKHRAHILYESLAGCVQRKDYSVMSKFLLPKYEYVIFIRLSPEQIKLYEVHLSQRKLGWVRDNTGRQMPRHHASVWADYHSLGRICTHPRVLQLHTIREQNKASNDVGEGVADHGDAGSDNEKSSGADTDGEEVTPEKSDSVNPPRWYEDIYNADVNDCNLNLSGKLVLLFDIIRYSAEIGDKILVFSQSLLSLDLIEDFLEMEHKNNNQTGGTGSWIEGADYFRVDGSTKPVQRQRCCEVFNETKNQRARLFLISTRAGSLGVNLVGANRVVIFDASWNPSHDIQAIYRAYRLGQTKPVFIYRFIAQGTMEEKVYERQVAKQSLFKRVIDEQQIKRHFTLGQLQELYTFTPDRLGDPHRKEQPILAPPKDHILADLLKNHSDWIVKYHDHDSLLENKIDEELSVEDRIVAWDEYHAAREGQLRITSNSINRNGLESAAVKMQELSGHQQQQQQRQQQRHHIGYCGEQSTQEHIVNNTETTVTQTGDPGTKKNNDILSDILTDMTKTNPWSTTISDDDTPQERYQLIPYQGTFIKVPCHEPNQWRSRHRSSSSTDQAQSTSDNGHTDIHSRSHLRKGRSGRSQSQHSETACSEPSQRQSLHSHSRNSQMACTSDDGQSGSHNHKDISGRIQLPHSETACSEPSQRQNLHSHSRNRQMASTSDDGQSGSHNHNNICGRIQLPHSETACSEPSQRQNLHSHSRNRQMASTSDDGQSGSHNHNNISGRIQLPHSETACSEPSQRQNRHSRSSCGQTASTSDNGHAQPHNHNASSLRNQFPHSETACNKPSQGQHLPSRSSSGQMASTSNNGQSQSQLGKGSSKTACSELSRRQSLPSGSSNSQRQSRRYDQAQSTSDNGHTDTHSKSQLRKASNERSQAPHETASNDRQRHRSESSSNHLSPTSKNGHKLKKFSQNQSSDRSRSPHRFGSHERSLYEPNQRLKRRAQSSSDQIGHTIDGGYQEYSSNQPHFERNSYMYNNQKWKRRAQSNSDQTGYTLDTNHNEYNSSDQPQFERDGCMSNHRWGRQSRFRGRSCGRGRRAKYRQSKSDREEHFRHSESSSINRENQQHFPNYVNNGVDGQACESRSSVRGRGRYNVEPIHFYKRTYPPYCDGYSLHMRNGADGTSREDYPVNCKSRDNNDKGDRNHNYERDSGKGDYSEPEPEHNNRQVFRRGGSRGGQNERFKSRGVYRDT